MKPVIVINATFFALSETFIYRQVQALTNSCSVTLASFKFENETLFPLNVQRRLIVKVRKGWLDRGLTFMVRKTSGFVPGFGFFASAKLHFFLWRNRNSLIHAHYGWRGVQILPHAKKLRMPLIVSFHGKDASAALSVAKYKAKLPELFNYAKFIVLCSPHMIETLGLHNWSSKVKLIPYGVNTSEFSPISRQTDNAVVRILHAGRLVPKKGVPDLIRAFRALADEGLSELHIIGDGEEFDMCKQLAAEGRFKNRILFYGALPVAEVRKAMQECEIFVLNSRTDDNGDMEGLPNVILEAMSCGMPVISTRHAAIPMVVEDKISGLLVDERDTEALADRMRVLVKDGQLRQQLGKMARARVVNHYSIEQMNERLQSLFR